MGIRIICAVFLFLTFLSGARAQESSHGAHGSQDDQHQYDDLRLESEKQGKSHIRQLPVQSKEENLESEGKSTKLLAEILEERELVEYGFYGHEYDHEQRHDDGHLSTKGLWFQAMGSSLLVSSASLVSLLILPFTVSNGKPPRGLVDALAAFGVLLLYSSSCFLLDRTTGASKHFLNWEGINAKIYSGDAIQAGSMLGDAFLHQLPHAFGRSAHSHGDEHHKQGGGGMGQEGEHSHGHSLADLSVGLAVLGGILLFFLIEKIVRSTEELSGGASFGHSHHRHRSKKDESDSEEEGGAQADNRDDDEYNSNLGLRKRTGKGEGESIGENISDKARFTELQGTKSKKKNESVNEVEAEQAKGSSKLVVGYLNLFSDDVHNFTDGMALGSAFLAHGTVGGWSRTLFLLAHELPQEVGDFGILVSSGFGVFKAIVFNFLSALVSLAGTAVALWMGRSAVNSSIIEGFTAGGFIYIAVGSVMPDMQSRGSSLRTSITQFLSLIVGMGIALALSLAE
ncbi:hypothetical protein R1sor_018806 [Riccia sorocarpa]|uniref:Uncharacterized protein n=1 Tax=Riccia sorocarpa TaxID=122646 RepID=A0ABD3IE30_9MARC